LQHKGGKKREGEKKRHRRKHFCVPPPPLSPSLHSKSLFITAVHQSQGVQKVTSFQDSLSYLVPFMIIKTISTHRRFYVEINTKKIFFILCPLVSRPEEINVAKFEPLE
jgi:hypothetical protein